MKINERIMGNRTRRYRSMFQPVLVGIPLEGEGGDIGTVNMIRAGRGEGCWEIHPEELARMSSVTRSEGNALAMTR